MVIYAVIIADAVVVLLADAVVIADAVVVLIADSVINAIVYFMRP